MIQIQGGFMKLDVDNEMLLKPESGPQKKQLVFIVS